MRFLSMAFAIALGGCGVADTGTAAATAGALKARDAERARTVPEQVQGKLDEAARLAEQKREAAEAR